LAAGALKLYGVQASAVPRLGWFAQPQVWVAAAVWEFVLGFWLLSGAQRALSWLAATGTFLVFAGVSGYLGWSGESRCGCLGAVRASPWVAFGVDVAALGLLAVGCPAFTRDLLRMVGAVAPVFASAFLVLGCLAGAGAWIYGSPKAALARLRGDLLMVNPVVVDFGTGSVG